SMPDWPPDRQPVWPDMTTDGRPAPKLSAQPCTSRPNVWLTVIRDGSVLVRSVGRIFRVTGAPKAPPFCSRNDIGRTPARWSVGGAPFVVSIQRLCGHDR